jgi:hypothetical protein
MDLSSAFSYIPLPSNIAIFITTWPVPLPPAYINYILVFTQGSFLTTSRWSKTRWVREIFHIASYASAKCCYLALMAAFWVLALMYDSFLSPCTHDSFLSPCIHVWQLSESLHSCMTAFWVLTLMYDSFLSPCTHVWQLSESLHSCMTDLWVALCSSRFSTPRIWCFRWSHEVLSSH